MAWADVIAQLLRESGCATEKALAALVGVTPTTLSGWKKGHHEPDDASIEKMAAVIGMSAAEVRRRAAQPAHADDDTFRLLAARFRELGPLDQADVLHDVLRRHAQRKGGAA